MDDFSLVVSLFSPLFLGLILHGLVIKFDWLSLLATPIDRGIRYRGRELFGRNKTYRGVVTVALGTAIGFLLGNHLFTSFNPFPLYSLSALDSFLVGLLLGGAAMLAELPNSFLKRQFGITPGSPARGPAAPIFYVLDQVDFLLGAWLVALWWVAPTLPRVLWSVAFVLVVHQLISLAGAWLGMRATAR